MQDCSQLPVLYYIRHVKLFGGVAERLDDYVGSTSFQPILDVLEELFQKGTRKHFNELLDQLYIADEYQTWGTTVSEILKFHNPEFRRLIARDLGDYCSKYAECATQDWEDTRVLACWLDCYHSWFKTSR